MPGLTPRLGRRLPRPSWLDGYDRAHFTADAVAAAIVTIVVIPQSLAYALLAGLPPEAGLYASILPLVGYALFGSSRTLSVGPVALVALLTASAVGRVAEPGTEAYTTAAVVLAGCSGLVLLLTGLLRLGWIASLLSYPVVSGFVSASGVLIAVSQIGPLLGVSARGSDLTALLPALARALPGLHLPTLAVGAGTLAFLLWVRHGLRDLLERLGAPAAVSDILVRAGPVVAVALATAVTIALDLAGHGVSVVGAVPAGLPTLTLPSLDPALWQALLPAAVLISLISFVESVAMARTLAARRRERVSPNRELFGLAAANLAAAGSGAMPVAGGFSRSAVNVDAGARTPVASLLTAGGLALVVSFATPAFHHLPTATLAAAIIVAVLQLVDLPAVRRTWQYARTDFAALLVTAAGVLFLGIETGVIAGVAVSLALFLWRTARPHIAVVGRVPGTEHFRNVERHRVITSPRVLGMRVDESLYFANIRYLEDTIWRRVTAQPEVTDVVLLCAAVNQIDTSALEGLETLNGRLSEAGVRLHLSEVKGPVMDRLKGTGFLDGLSGQVFLSQYAALQALAPETLSDRPTP